MFPDKDMPQYNQIIEGLKKHIIPEKYPDLPENRVLSSFGPELGMGSLLAREEIISLSGYPLIAYEWIRPLASWIGQRKCFEVMAGSGALAKALQDCGVDITASDNYTWEQDWYDERAWTEVEHLDALDAVEEYGPQAELLLLSWPYIGDTAYKLLMKMRQVNPNLTMIYIGEGLGGVCANDDFFEEAEVIADSSFLEAVRNFKQACGINDRPRLFR